MRVGDHVLPAKAGLGIWRTDGHHKEADVFPIDNTLPLEASATLQVYTGSSIMPFSVFEMPLALR